MRGFEEFEIAAGLAGIGGLVAPLYAHRLVEAKAAFASPLFVDTGVFTWKSEMRASHAPGIDMRQ